METTEQFVKSTTSSLLLILNKFYTLFWCFHCWLWTSKCWLGKICGLENYLSLSHFMYIMDVSFLNIWSFCNFTGPLEGLRLLRGKVVKGIYNLHKIKLASDLGVLQTRQVGSGTKPQELWNIWASQHRRWLKIDIITSRKIKYWKDFSQQNWSSPTFIKTKKGHIKGPLCRHFPPVPTVLS